MQARPMLSGGVHVSVTFVNSVKTSKCFFKTFLPLGTHAVLVFQYQTSWQYSDGNSRNRALNAGGVGRNRDPEPMSGSVVCCQRYDQLGAINMVLPCHGKL